MEQANLQNLLDFTEYGFSGAFNNLVANPQFSAAFATPFQVMLCPSDPAPTQNTGAGGAIYAGLNYGSARNEVRRFETPRSRN
jgi:hypothetical protein